MTKRKYKIPDIEQVEDLSQPEVVEPRVVGYAGKIVGLDDINEVHTPIVPMTALHIRGCSACGSDHDNVPEYILSEPIMDGLHVVGTHYAICPTTEQIVYIRHLKEE